MKQQVRWRSILLAKVFTFKVLSTVFWRLLDSENGAKQKMNPHKFDVKIILDVTFKKYAEHGSSAPKVVEAVTDSTTPAQNQLDLIYQNNFFHRCVSCWNHLPSNVSSATSLKQFRNALARVDLINYCSTDFNFNLFYVLF